MITETFAASSAQQDFPFSTPYLSAAHLSVKVDGVATTDWTLTTAQLLRLGDASFSGVNALVGGELVEISRSTPIVSPMVTFASPSTLRSSEINRAILQVFYNLQEQDAETLSAIRSDAGFTKWLAQSLPLKDLGAPVDSTDAARLADIENAIVAGGNIPAFSIADAGRALGINKDGNVGWEAPGGGISSFSVVTQTPEPVLYADGGALLPETTNGSQTVGSALPVQKDADHTAWWSGTAPYVSGDYDIVLPSTGLYEVEVVGSVRSIPSGAIDTQSYAAMYLTNSTGTAAFDQRENIRLGISGPGVGVTDTWQASNGYTLRAILTVSGSLSINLRGVRINDPAVVADVPTRITVKEIR